MKGKKERKKEKKGYWLQIDHLYHICATNIEKKAWIGKKKTKNKRQELIFWGRGEKWREKKKGPSITKIPLADMCYQ